MQHMNVHPLTLTLTLPPKTHTGTNSSDSTRATRASLSQLTALLQRVEHFYDSIGGLVGYQAKSISLILEGVEEGAAQQHAVGQQGNGQQQQQYVPHSGVPMQVCECELCVNKCLDLC